MPYLTLTGGLQLFYKERGAGDPLLFLAGTDGDLLHHDAVSPFRTQLAETFRLLTYDERGLGSSDAPDVAYTMADYADDARGVLDVIGWDRPFVVGYSFGGMVAQELALRHPERVRKLVLLNTSSGGAGGASYPVHQLAGLGRDELHRRRCELWDTRHDRTWQLLHPEQMQAWGDEWDALAVVGAQDHRRIGQARQLGARKAHDTFDRLPALTMPVILVTGQYDGIAPPERQFAMASQLAHCEIGIFQGGHRVLWEDSTAAQAITDFLSRDLQVWPAVGLTQK
ncbi:alpha/beta hydrolase [Streptomyces sp. SCSIO 30461]|uniref:alpha/beta fold hydrolase n=1 Tax=Streptomyces sp. SCSIO 30461 TaxID=3118085 RepID=UPI0030D41459